MGILAMIGTERQRDALKRYLLYGAIAINAFLFLSPLSSGIERTFGGAGVLLLLYLLIKELEIQGTNRRIGC